MDTVEDFNSTIVLFTVEGEIYETFIEKGFSFIQLHDGSKYYFDEEMKADLLKFAKLKTTDV